MKGAAFEPTEEYPVVIVMGKVLKKPQVYTDERGQVTTCYQDYLEKQWVQQLRMKYEVQINSEVWLALLNQVAE